MKQGIANLNRDPAVPDLARRLLSVGIVLARCDEHGAIVAGSFDESDWLASVLLRSRFVPKAVREAAVAWSGAAEPCCTHLCAGCWCVPLPLQRRRKRIGYVLLLIPTADLLAHEQFRAMCQAAQLDVQACIQRLSSSLPNSATEVDRIARLAAFLHNDHQQLLQLTATMESVGQQLSESYEEINLLYTISQSMTVVQQPKRFVLTACEGLLDTLSYEWIAAQFLDGIESLRSLSGRMVIAGTPQIDVQSLRRLTSRLLQQAKADVPEVIDPSGKSEHGEFAPLGQPILVHPINREGRMLGILIAANKQGADRAASSADMKLLGAAASHTSIFLENAALYEDMDAMFLGTLEAITASIDAKDRYTCGHSQRVAQLSQQLAVAAGLDEDAVRRVHVAGLVHDVGKIGVPESVLSKPGRLTPAEFDLIKQHPEIGYRILKDIPQLRDVLPGVLHHHERWDGLGYPAGLKGTEIPIFARLIALADSFDAMSSTRTYRAARDRRWVIEEIRRSAGSQFDPSLAEVFTGLEFAEYDRLVAEHRANDAVRTRLSGEAA